MKKACKTALTLALAVLMLLSLSVSAFADTGVALTVDTDKVITNTANVVLGNVPEKITAIGESSETSMTLTTYQVIYASYDSASNAVAYHMTDWAKTALAIADEPAEQAYIKAHFAVDADSTTAIATTGTSASEQDVLVNKLAGTADKTEFTAEWTLSGQQAAADLPVGVYLVSGRSTGLSFLNMLVSVDLTAVSTAKDGWQLNAHGAVLKAEPISLTKTTSGEETKEQTAQVGDILTYDVTVAVPCFPANADYTIFRVTDTPTNLAILNTEANPITVYGVKGETKTDITGQVLDAESASAITVTEDGSSMTVDFSDAYFTVFTDRTQTEGEEPVITAYTYDKVLITYSVRVLDSALTTNKTENDVTLIYNPNPYSDEEDESHTDKNDVFVYGVELLKADTKGEKLTNAGFGIYTGSGEDLTALKFIQLTEGSYTVADESSLTGEQTENALVTEVLTAGADGKVTVSGLNRDVTYTMKETTAPSGYAIDDTEVTFIIADNSSADGAAKPDGLIDSVTFDAKQDAAWTMTEVTANSAPTFTLNLTDTKLVQLPQTGGIGTTVFTIGGVVLMLAGLALVIFGGRRKKEK